MSNFGELILDVMNEQGKTIKDLEKDNVLGKNTFYIFNDTNPSLKTLIKLGNYLNVSIDYILGKTTENNFRKYKINQTNFYDNLINIMKNSKITIFKLCSDLGISRTNFTRWKRTTVPSLEKLMDLSTYLNCTIDDLLDRE